MTFFDDFLYVMLCYNSILLIELLNLRDLLEALMRISNLFLQRNYIIWLATLYTFLYLIKFIFYVFFSFIYILLFTKNRI